MSKIPYRHPRHAVSIPGFSRWIPYAYTETKTETKTETFRRNLPKSSEVEPSQKRGALEGVPSIKAGAFSEHSSRSGKGRWLPRLL
jgi:hypothetical protein